MSILLDVRCRRHPRYNGVQYPRRSRSPDMYSKQRCETCVELWRLKRGLHFGIKTLTSGENS